MMTEILKINAPLFIDNDTYGNEIARCLPLNPSIGERRGIELNLLGNFTKRNKFSLYCDKGHSMSLF